MANKTRDGAQNQHYVPQFIIRNFLTGDIRKEQVRVFDKETGRTFTPNIRGIMAERRFNEFVIDDEWLASFEPAICKIEEQVLPIYQDIVSNRRLRGTSEERGYLAFLMAFQMVRTKAQRERFPEVSTLLRQKLLGIGATEEDVKHLEFGPDELKVRHAEFMRKALEDFSDALVNKDFLLIQAAQGRTFYLSDNPVAMHNGGPKHPFWGNIGLSVLGIEVYLPLTSNLLLCAWCPSLLERFRQDRDTQRTMLADALLKNVMSGRIPASYMKMQLETINQMARPVADLLRHAEDGTCFTAADTSMDFYNSLQMSYGRRHVISQDGNWEIARRFMQDNPGHTGKGIIQA